MTKLKVTANDGSNKLTIATDLEHFSEATAALNEGRRQYPAYSDWRVEIVGKKMPR